MKLVHKPPKHIGAKKRFWWFMRRFYILLILAAIYIPLIIIVLLSFNGQTDRGNIILNFGVPDVINYIELFKNNDFLNALLNSVIISIIVVPISLIIAVITCFGIWNSKNKYVNTIVGASKVSIAIPEPITAISLALLFTSTVLPLGLNFGMFTVCLAHVSFCTPYAIVAIFPRMQKMPKNLIWASYDLGYSRIKTFFKVVLPYLAPALLSASAIVLAMSLDDFIITSLINGSTQTISTAIYTTRKGIKAWVVTFGALMVMITAIVVIIVSIVRVRKTRKANIRWKKGIYEKLIK
ncbi:MAG: ABC transporter permease [Mycoplasma sp.]|nr:ABC transporter permease [Candidatus Hennigella equi]